MEDETLGNDILSARRETGAAQADERRGLEPVEDGARKPTDTQAVAIATLAQIDAEIKKLQAARDALEALSPADYAVEDEVPAIPRDAFVGMIISEATRKYLRMAQRLQTTEQVAAALEAGGLQSGSQNFAQTVKASLRVRPEFIRLLGSWGLVEWLAQPTSNNKRRATPSSVRGRPKRVA